MTTQPAQPAMNTLNTSPVMSTRPAPPTSVSPRIPPRPAYAALLARWLAHSVMPTRTPRRGTPAYYKPAEEPKKALSTSGRAVLSKVSTQASYYDPLLIPVSVRMWLDKASVHTINNAKRDADAVEALCWKRRGGKDHAATQEMFYKMQAVLEAIKAHTFVVLAYRPYNLEEIRSCVDAIPHVVDRPVPTIAIIKEIDELLMGLGEGAPEALSMCTLTHEWPWLTRELWHDLGSFHSVKAWYIKLTKPHAYAYGSKAYPHSFIAS